MRGWHLWQWEEQVTWYLSTSPVRLFPSFTLSWPVNLSVHKDDRVAILGHVSVFVFVSVSLLMHWSPRWYFMIFHHDPIIDNLEWFDSLNNTKCNLGFLFSTLFSSLHDLMVNIIEMRGEKKSTTLSPCYCVNPLIKKNVNKCCLGNLLYVDQLGLSDFYVLKYILILVNKHIIFSF